MAKNYIISESELDQIAREVNISRDILWIHFTGGEPSLFFSKIKYFQNRVLNKKVKYRLTSNGSFPIRSLSEVKLDLLSISYDKFHSK